MAKTINTRTIPDDLYHRVRLAAANGGDRIPKGGLERFVIRALKRAVEDPQPGFGLPKLKLCAHCVSVNLPIINAPKTNLVPGSSYSTTEIRVDLEKKPTTELFSHLFEEDEGQSAAVSGMLEDPDVDRVDIFASTSDGRATGPVEIVTTKRPIEAPESILEQSGAVEVCEGLWVGSDHAYGMVLNAAPYAIIHAAKEPWHRDFVGYATKSAPEGPDRLFARRGNEIALNLLDVRKLGPGGEHYVPEAVIDAALAFIKERNDAGDVVMIHAGDGRSAAPTIAFLYMLRAGLLPLHAAMPAFAQLYPIWEPGAGMARFLEIELETKGEKTK